VREGAFAVVLAEHLPAPAAVSLAAASRLLITAVELAVVAALVAAGRRQRSPIAAKGAESAVAEPPTDAASDCVPTPPPANSLHP
jgi:hypothetical protein